MRISKFSETELAEIETLIRKGTHIKVIAKEYNVDFGLIYKLKNNLEIKDPTFNFSDVRVIAKDKNRGRTIKLNFPNCTEEKINFLFKLLTENDIKYKLWTRDKEILNSLQESE